MLQASNSVMDFDSAQTLLLFQLSVAISTIMEIPNHLVLKPNEPKQVNDLTGNPNHLDTVDKGYIYAAKYRFEISNMPSSGFIPISLGFLYLSNKFISDPFRELQAITV